MTRTLICALGTLIVAGGCTRTTRTAVLEPSADVQRGPSTAATLGLPPGQLPQVGECRVWIPGTPPGRQPRPRSRNCAGIAAFASPGSWIIYRPLENRKLVYVREVAGNGSGAVIRTRIYDIDTNRFLREEHP